MISINLPETGILILVKGPNNLSVEFDSFEALQQWRPQFNVEQVEVSTNRVGYRRLSSGAYAGGEIVIKIDKGANWVRIIANSVENALRGYQVVYPSSWFGIRH